MTTTANRLKYLMSERNLRQVDIIRLAEPFCKEYNLKLTKSDMSQFISGKVEPGQWKLTILGKALNVSEVWLMGYDVPMEREHNSSAPNPSAREDFTDLTSNEKTLVSTFRTLNPNGQQLALTAMQSFAANPDLTQDTASKAG